MEVDYQLFFLNVKLIQPKRASGENQKIQVLRKIGLIISS